jgi:hypothetical protein
MLCYHPLTAWRSKYVNPSGKRSLVFNPTDALQPDDPLNLPCGQCGGCRLERSRQWAMRIMHESQLHLDNCFITLTYDPEHLPEDLSVRKHELQKFFKRLRKKFSDVKIKYFGCGEYGEQNFRPHYHAILFNLDFHDKELHQLTKTGHKLYTSETLSKIWPFGFVTIGDVTFESAAYVARYVMKKRTGDSQETKDHYTRVDDSNGLITEVEPEFVLMSQSIGKDWYEQYGKNVHEKDFITMRGIKMKPPKFYDKLFIQNHEDSQLAEAELKDIKEKRAEFARKHFDETIDERLRVREKIQQRKIKQLVRTV